MRRVESFATTQTFAIAHTNFPKFSSLNNQLPFDAAVVSLC